MSYASLLTPRQEVLSDQIEGIIDLANIGKRGKLENKAEAFLDLTYPTGDVKRVLAELHRRFSSDKPEAGLFLFEGLKGSGKSHLLLLIYHLLKSPKHGRTWLTRHGLECSLPDNALVVINKFTDKPLLSIWDFVYERVGGTHASGLQPSLEELESVLDGRQLILILDELEQGIRVLPSDTIRAQNIAFLQMLSEWANRSNQVTVFASVYTSQQEPGETMKRVPRCEIRFEHAEDKNKVVLHRLFENYTEFSPSAAEPTIDSYLNVWKRHGTFDTDKHRDEMFSAFPFSPDLLRLLLEEVPHRGGFQHVRGALGFLGHLVRLTHKSADLITSAHADILDREVAVRLGDLDPSGHLISRARANLEELKNQPLAKELAAAVMLYTLAVTEEAVGATRDELIRAIFKPGGDINEFEGTLLAFQKYASHFHIQEGHHFFDLQENADAKVEFTSLKYDDAVARQILHDMWKEQVFRETGSVVFSNADATKEALEALDSHGIRWCLAPRRLAAEERHSLYHGLSLRNQVVLLEPKDEKFSLDADKDLVKWAKRFKAAEDLSKGAPDAERKKEYQRIGAEDQKHILDRIRRAGMVFTHFEHYGSAATEDGVEFETFGNATSKEDILHKLSTDHFPTQLFCEHVTDRLAEVLDRTVGQIEQEYRNTLGFPVPTHQQVRNALENLCQARVISLQHSRGNFCGERPGLSHTELSDATIAKPFAAEPPEPPQPPQPPRPPQPPQPPHPPEPPKPPPGVRVESVSVPPQPSVGALRQEVAVRLQELAAVTITQARFVIYFNDQVGDLSTLPTSIRGGLSGPGRVTSETAIVKEGEFSKGDVEQLAENLPVVNGAEYQATLTTLVQEGESSDD